jgi:hypothetical protein
VGISRDRRVREKQRLARLISDENIGESIDYQTNAPIICITGYIIQIERVFEIAERFRALGKSGKTA